MAESLTFNIGADTSGFQTGLGGILTGLAGLAAAFVSVQAIVEGFSNAIEMGGRLHDLSTRTGETAGNLAILERAFENASVGAERLGPAIAKMQKAMVDMQQGNKEAVAAFEQLGLAWADLAGKSPAEQMELIGLRLSAIEDPALRAETAMRIFGKSGAELIPVLVNFTQETALAEEQLGTLPAQLDASAAAVDQFGDNLSAIGNKMTEFAYGFLSEVMPALNMFTNKLATFDAASIGAGLADALVGAFVNPMKAAAMLGDILLLGAKKMGNELIFQVQYWSDVLFRTFSTISQDLIPILGNNMIGAFDMAAGSLGNAIAETLRPVADMLGLDFIEEMAQGSKELMEQGAAKIAESANQFASALEGAKNSSTVVRQDFFGAEESAAKIEEKFAGLQQDAKAAMDALVSPEMAAGRTMTESDTILLDAIQKADAAALVKQTPTIISTGGGSTMTAAQMQAALNKQLGLIAASSPTQAIGQAASARRVKDLQDQLASLQALGKGDTAEANAIAASITRNMDVIQGISLTQDDRDIARDWAFQQVFEGSDQTITDLTDLAEQNILEQKRKDAGLVSDASTQKEKAKQAAAAGGGAGAQTVQSIANAVLGILQKIEPKLPQHIMS